MSRLDKLAEHVQYDKEFSLKGRKNAASDAVKQAERESQTR